MFKNYLIRTEENLKLWDRLLFLMDSMNGESLRNQKDFLLHPDRKIEIIRQQTIF